MLPATSDWLPVVQHHDALLYKSVNHVTDANILRPILCPQAPEPVMAEDASIDNVHQQ